MSALNVCENCAADEKPQDKATDSIVLDVWASSLHDCLTRYSRTY